MGGIMRNHFPNYLKHMEYNPLKIVVYFYSHICMLFRIILKLADVWRN